ncbi:BIR1B protein, partial [Atractosteus spatula]|nr:BIR1B protein [Atractosteus spatula]
MIEESLQDSNMCLNEESFRKMIYGLRNQVLFLWDDYGITGSPPGSVNELVLKNHMSQTAVVIGVQMNRTAQDPSANMDERKIFEAYLHYTLQKPRQESVKVAAVISSCGDLALEGLFTKQFEFTEESLWDAGIDSGDVLALGLMSKFTTQMLFPVYKFFHVSFQEYLAAKRLSDHFESDTEEQLKRGWCYLAQINTYFKVMFDYQSFLSYACSFSATTTEKIVRHLFSASESQDFFESRTENMKLLEKHPQHLHNAQMVRKFLHTSASREIWREHFFTIKISLHSSCLPSCAPHILQYLSGKSQFAEMGGGNAIEMFFNLYPQSLSLLSDVVILITGFEKTDANHFLKIENALKSPCQPSVEEDYAPAFHLLRDVAEMNIANERKIDHIQSMRLCHLSETTVSTLVRVGQGHTLPLLKIKVSYLHRLADGDRVKLQCLFTVFHSVELILESAEGFLESIQDVIEQNWANFRRLAFSGSHLTRQEEDLVLSMSSLEHLDLFSKKTPEFLISNLDKLSRLKELKVTSESKVLDSISDGFKHLQNLDAFTLKLFDSEDDTSKLAFLLRHFPNLKHISLRLPRCPNFNEVTAVLSTCRKLEHIHFEHFLHFDRGVSELASALPKFENVKVLNLETQDIQDKESARIFAQALGSLVNLQELHLPLGNRMKAALPTVLEQLQHIRQLQVLTIGVILEDHSLYQLAKLSKESFLQSVQKLDLEINHGVTDAGWRDFFQTLDNLPHLKDLLVSRHYSQTLKPHASTVRAFVQCVSRLPSLMLIVMYGWLLDSEDLNMFNQMKRQHPQSQCLKLIWQWVLPFSPQILRETF